MDYDSAMPVDAAVEGTPLNIDALWDIFVNQVQVNAPEAVVTETCQRLAEVGIEHEYQIIHCPPDYLKEVLPPATHIRHYLAAMHVQKTLLDYQKPVDPQTKSAAAFNRVADEMRKSRRKGHEDSDSEVEVKEFDGMAALKEYGLTVPNTYLPTAEKMQTAAKRAATNYKRGKPFLAEGDFSEYVPRWMRDVPKKELMQTHAHWCSAFWTRALAQLAAQGHSDKETVSVSDLLVLFLKLNRMAVENSGRVSWEYDSSHWGDLVDRIKHCDPELNLSKEFLEVTKSEKDRIVEKLARARASSSQPQVRENDRVNKRKRDAHERPPLDWQMRWPWRRQGR